MDREIKNFDIVVIIATKNRPKLLKERALSSIVDQVKMPSAVIIIDDSNEKFRSNNQNTIKEFNCSTKCIYLTNQRTSGASGAWNTGIDWVVNHYDKRLSDVYISILDDDDKWEANYIASCVELIQNDPQIDWIASDFYRIEKSIENKKLQTAPEEVSKDLFLMGNPGIQGSNLFLRLSTLLEAGGFDENLSSCTDRDLCIRLCDLNDVNYVHNSNVLMLHYAELERVRLSTPNSLNKNNGLREFWKKYKDQMSEVQKNIFCKRTEELFKWTPENISLKEKPAFFEGKKGTLKSIPSIVESVDEFNLYIGVITSDSQKINSFLTSIYILDELKCLTQIDITILCNGIAASVIQDNIKCSSIHKFSTHIIDENVQVLDAKAGLFGECFMNRPLGVLGIAQTRTMIQKYVGLKAMSDSQGVSWILDDDMKIDFRALSYIPWLPTFKKKEIDVLIGCYEGASPNPPLNGLRVLLVDLLYNIFWLKGLEPSSQLPNRSDENHAKRVKYPDYYYDLSRKHTGHLETPFWIEPEYLGETVQEAYSRLLSYAPLIVTGHPLTRSIFAPKIKGNPVDSSVPSVNRGGTTFILNPEALLRVPNLILKINGREARRSDMMWAIVNRQVEKMDIRAVAFPIIHDSRVNSRKTLNIPKVVDEIIGSTLYAALGDFLKRNTNHSLNFSETEIKEIWKLIIRFRDFRLCKLQQNSLRIMGLTKALGVISSDEELGGLLKYLSKSFSVESFEKIKNEVLKMKPKIVENFLNSLRSDSKSFADSNNYSILNECKK